LTEIKTWAKWDEIEHDKMTERIIDDGVSIKQLFNAGQDIQKMYIDADEMLDYYSNLKKSDPLFCKPFSLFSGQVQIGLTERINLLERETVKHYKDMADQV
jgi:hypothetical protein